MPKLTAETIQIVNIDTIQPNSWNPNENDDFMTEHIKQSIKEFGFVDPITVRQIGKDKYEIIDGEYRWKALKELGETTIKIINLGKVSDTIAKQLTLNLRNRGNENDIKLVDLLKDLESDIGIEEMIKNIPIPQQDIEALLTLTEFSDNIVEDDISDLDTETKFDIGKWSTLVFRVPDDALQVIESEMDRIGSILDLDPGLPENVRRGLILEKVCVLSAQTPLQSLE